MSRPQLHTVIGIVAATLVFAVLAWHRRWISDDGLIVVRTVRNILAGNGPVFNAFERAESNTSTLWPWLLALVVGVTGGEPVFTTVVVGWLLSVAGFAIALDGTRRWQVGRTTASLVPAGALVVLGAFPFWDYATSGLETGLSTFWLACAWWLLVRVRKLGLGTVVALGLGPLVRPDLALVSGVFLVAAWLIARPSRGRTIALAAAAIALPLAYEIFRAGYYGTLVPLPALAKSATGAEWGRGLDYVVDFARPCLVYVPLAILAALFVGTQRHRWPTGRDRVLIGAALASGLLLALFVVRVGGDFMHARMMLPPTLLVLLPGFVVPLRRRSAPAVALLAVWALAIGVWRGDGKTHATAKTVEDERAGYVRWTKTANPVTADPFIAATPAATKVEAAVRDGRHAMMSEGGIDEAANPAWPAPVIYAAGRLGTGGAIVPLDGIVVDTLGLANPLGARITSTNPGITGHEKGLPWSWVRADFVDPALDDNPLDGTKAAAIRAARHAMQCGDLAELLDAVRAPMTAGRFWDNLTGAVRRTRLVIPSDPIAAEAAFCGDGPPGVVEVTASSSYEANGWSTSFAADGQRRSLGPWLGYSSQVGPAHWLVLRFAARRRIEQVTLYPRSDAMPGGGFPIDFTIQTWDGERWVDRVTRTDYPNPGTTPQVFALPPVETDRIRIDATRVPDVGGGERLQLAEVEVR